MSKVELVMLARHPYGNRDPGPVEAATEIGASVLKFEVRLWLEATVLGKDIL